jgi:hypothetical protein
VNFLRVESLETLPAVLAELPGQELTVMQYLDARGPDGKTRKYRAMTIDGKLYPLHLAISDHWKIHSPPAWRIKRNTVPKRRPFWETCQRCWVPWR